MPAQAAPRCTVDLQVQPPAAGLADFRCPLPNACPPTHCFSLDPQRTFLCYSAAPTLPNFDFSLTCTAPLVRFVNCTCFVPPARERPMPGTLRAMQRAYGLCSSLADCSTPVLFKNPAPLPAPCCRLPPGTAPLAAATKACAALERAGTCVHQSVALALHTSSSATLGSLPCSADRMARSRSPPRRRSRSRSPAPYRRRSRSPARRSPRRRMSPPPRRRSPDYRERRPEHERPPPGDFRQNGGPPRRDEGFPPQFQGRG
jgi:hypothetical protein